MGIHIINGNWVSQAVSTRRDRVLRIGPEAQRDDLQPNSFKKR